MRKCSTRGKLSAEQDARESESEAAEEAQKLAELVENHLREVEAAKGESEPKARAAPAAAYATAAVHGISAASAQCTSSDQHVLPVPQHGPHGHRKSITARATNFRQSVFDKAEGVPKQAAGHLRAHDIVHVNTNTMWLDLGHRIMFGPPLLVLLFALIFYVMCTIIFACLFYSFGADCYKLTDDFSFEAMLWISTHTFSTVGFGNIAPLQTCSSAQLVVLIESFVSLLVVSTIGGYVVKMFLRPLSRVRFSRNILLNNGRRRVQVDDNDDNAMSGALPNASLSLAESSIMCEASRNEAGKYKFLTFRMVRQGRVQLRDVRVQMQAQYWISGSTAFGDRDSHKGRVVSLQLEQNYFTTLEQLQVWHKLDESSPLFRMRHKLHVHLDGIEVSITAVDSMRHTHAHSKQRADVPP